VGLVLTSYTLLEARKRAVVSRACSPRRVLSGVISFCAETAHATAQRDFKRWFTHRNPSLAAAGRLSKQLTTAAKLLDRRQARLPLAAFVTELRDYGAASSESLMHRKRLTMDANKRGPQSATAPTSEVFRERGILRPPLAAASRLWAS
jgi:hypothetical protein